MNTKDKMLRYLAGMMPESELREFENELSKSEKLSSELNKLKRDLQDLSPDFSESYDHQYFRNLVPDIRAEMEKRRTGSGTLIKYLAPACILVLAYFLIPFRSSSLLEEQINDLNDSSKTEMLYLIDESVPLEENDLIEYAVTGQLEQEALNGIDAGYIATEDLIENLSEEQVNQIYSAMLNKKIL